MKHGLSFFGPRILGFRPITYNYGKFVSYNTNDLFFVR